MKIAYFTESLPPSTDGVAKTLTRLANSLIDRKIEFRFFSPFKPQLDVEWTDRVVKMGSIPFLLYPDYRVSLPWRDGIYENLNDFQPDIIHATSPTPLCSMGLKYAEKKGIPAVSSYHTHFVDYFKYYGFRRFENVGWNYLKWFYNRFRRIYVPSPSSAVDLKNRGFENLELWQRGIDLSKFSPNLRSPALRQSVQSDTEPILLFVGRLVKEKDLDDLIDSNNILRKLGERFKLVIVGDGPMKSELMQKLPDAEFTGWLHGEKLAQWYASSDLFVFPSTTETFGNVILEAAASGIPSIGVNKGGVADIIEHGKTGFIAQANDPYNFALFIQHFLKNKDERIKIGHNAREYAKNYSWDAINGRLLQSYEETIIEFSRN